MHLFLKKKTNFLYIFFISKQNCIYKLSTWGTKSLYVIFTIGIIIVCPLITFPYQFYNEYNIFQTIWIQERNLCFSYFAKQYA